LRSVTGVVDIFIRMHTTKVPDMQYTKEQLIDALVYEWDYLCHDDYDPDDDTPEEYRLKLELLTTEELVEETSTGEGYTLEEFMENWL